MSCWAQIRPRLWREPRERGARFREPNFAAEEFSKNPLNPGNFLYPEICRRSCVGAGGVSLGRLWDGPISAVWKRNCHGNWANPAGLTGDPNLTHLVAGPHVRVPVSGVEISKFVEDTSLDIGRPPGSTAGAWVARFKSGMAPKSGGFSRS